MIDLWAGIGGLILATAALGMRCVVLAAESDMDLRTAKGKLFPNLVEIDHVESISVRMLEKVMARRTFCAVLVGVGYRQGRGDDHGWQPLHLRRIVQEIQQKYPCIPVF